MAGACRGWRGLQQCSQRHAPNTRSQKAGTSSLTWQGHNSFRARLRILASEFLVSSMMASSSYFSFAWSARRGLGVVSQEWRQEWGEEPGLGQNPAPATPPSPSQSNPLRP